MPRKFVKKIPARRDEKDDLSRPSFCAPEHYASTGHPPTRPISPDGERYRDKVARKRAEGAE